MNQLEQQFRSFMGLYGYPVLLLHTKDTMPCTCFDEVTGSADRDCPFCFGMGTVPVITKETTRDTDSGTPAIAQALFGEVSVPERAYYFYKETQVKPDDLIIDVDWQGSVPVHTGRGIYEVSHVDPARFIKGEVVFQKVYVKDQPIEKHIRGFNITQRAGQVLYQMAERRD